MIELKDGFIFFIKDRNHQPKQVLNMTMDDYRLWMSARNKAFPEPAEPDINIKRVQIHKAFTAVIGFDPNEKHEMTDERRNLLRQLAGEHGLTLFRVMAAQKGITPP